MRRLRLPLALAGQGGEFAKDMNVLGKHRGQIIEEE